ncbi:type VI secretion system-associated protein TagO [Cohaesibacter gelatinilyticus]|uniref:Type VI secretion-associated protein, VC_A0118 family n=1 Tax=Cohaesibacter gelatinilyticus TaxID=372072 RepID=A0A285PP67_9HYPH|nr:type VI secretion system-associated protein TagO [Cohaesibacter gelatinilyticus]SNZ21721.1 type VI secretion-associated protein, VC_A0118 family [Cohaesibacter gelatinilyticus]
MRALAIIIAIFLAGNALASDQQGHWKAISKRSKISGKPFEVIYVEANDGANCSAIGSQPAYFAFKCDEGTPLVALHTNCVMNDEDYNEIQYRFDEDEVRAKYVHRLPDMMGQYIRMNSAIEFAKEALGKKELVIRASDHRGAFMEMDFNITGIEEAIEPVRKACNW